MRLLASLFILLLSITPAHADENGFAHWLFTFKQKAAASGINSAFVHNTLSRTQYLPRVIELDRKQPENKITFAKYRKNVISDARIRDGRARMAQYAPLLKRISRQYGVAPQYIVALWGIETSYGRITGGFDTLSALATLAYEGRRASYFENELMLALRILAGGHAGTSTLTGSWAGAMGQCQFMPKSYFNYAVDGNRDGTIDIWHSLPDVFASIANYLRTEGWQGDMRWGRAVRVPHGLSKNMYGRDKMRPLSYWRSIGVRQINGHTLPYTTDGTDPKAALVAPDGPGTPTFLVYNNYNVIMHWNRSTYFATSVGILADAIASAGK